MNSQTSAQESSIEATDELSNLLFRFDSDTGSLKKRVARLERKLRLLKPQKKIKKAE